MKIVKHMQRKAANAHKASSASRLHAAALAIA